MREEEVLNLIRSITTAAENENNNVVNLSKMLSELSNDITMRMTMGRHCKDRAGYLKLLSDVMEVTSGFSAADLFPSFPILGWLGGSRQRIEVIFRGMDRIVEDIIEEHREKRRLVATSGDGDAEEEEDLLDVLLRNQEQGSFHDHLSLSMENIKALIQEIFAAGSDTSSTTLEWDMSELARNPKAMRKAQLEAREVLLEGRIRTAAAGATVTESETMMRQLNYIHQVIKETLRLHPPAPLLLPRECRETCGLLGRHEIPAKTRVVINAWAIGRDSKYWEDPEEFKPERFEGASSILADSFKGSKKCDYLPFGAGRRMCPGVDFGLATVTLALAHLLCFFDWEIPTMGSGKDLDMTETFGTTSRRKTPLLLRAFPHFFV